MEKEEKVDEEEEEEEGRFAASPNEWSGAGS